MHELSSMKSMPASSFHPSDIVPLWPASMTGIEAAALEERCLRVRDSAVARCFRVPAAFVTRLRHEQPSSYAELEAKWFTEGHVRLAAIQQREAQREAARDQRLRECFQMQLSRDIRLQDNEVQDTQVQNCEVQHGDQHFQDAEAEASHSEEPARSEEECPASRKRWSFGLTCGDALGWLVLVAGAGFYIVGILYPGGWTGAWSDWIGVIR